MVRQYSKTLGLLADQQMFKGGLEENLGLQQDKCKGGNSEIVLWGFG